MMNGITYIKFEKKEEAAEFARCLKRLRESGPSPLYNGLLQSSIEKIVEIETPVGDSQGIVDESAQFSVKQQ